MPCAGVHGDPFQPFFVWRIGEEALNALVVGHGRQGTTAEFTPCGDVDGDQRVGLFLNGMESAAIAIDGNPFQIVDADKK